MSRPTKLSDLRPSVAAFALAMEEKLREHDEDRGSTGWATEHHLDLFDRLCEEVLELRDLITQDPNATLSMVGVHWYQIFGEVADIGNFAMMIADNFGALEDKKADLLPAKVNYPQAVVQDTP